MIFSNEKTRSSRVLRRFFGAALLLAAFGLNLPGTPAFANLSSTASPRLLSFQGRLTDSNSNPLTGTFSVTFGIWDTGPGTGGNLIWSETQSVTTDNGLFSVMLGTETFLSATVFSSTSTGAPTRWLEIAIGTNTALAPRQPVVSVAYAFTAATVDDGAITNSKLALSGLDLSKFSTGTISATLIGPGPLGAAVVVSSISVGAITDGQIAVGAGIQESKIANLTTDLAARVLKAGDVMTGDLQMGQANASTFSASGFLSLANLSSPPGTIKRGEIYFDPTGVGALKLSLDGSSFVSLATGSVGGAFSVVSNASEFAGDGSGTALSLVSSSVTMVGNTFNGPNLLVRLDGTGSLPNTVIASSIAAGAITDAQIATGAGIQESKIAGLTTDLAARVLKAGDTMTGDLQVGQATGSTISVSGYIAMANLASPPVTVNRGEIYFDPSGFGALKVSLNGSTFVSLATGTVAGGGGISLENASQFTGDGASTTLTLRSSSVTLQGNTFNGPNELLQLDGAGNLPNTVIVSSLAAGSINSLNQFSTGMLTNGQLIIGKTGSAPVASTLTASSAIIVTNGPGSISLALNPSSVTMQGNTFNGPNQLVMLNGSSQYPALDGSLILRVSSIAAGAYVGVTAGALSNSSSGTITVGTAVSTFSANGDLSISGNYYGGIANLTNIIFTGSGNGMSLGSSTTSCTSPGCGFNIAIYLINASGGAVTGGCAVTASASVNQGFTTSAAASDSTFIGVVTDANCASNAVCRVAMFGNVRVQVPAATAIVAGNFMDTNNVACQAKDGGSSSSAGSNSRGRFLENFTASTCASGPCSALVMLSAH